MRWILGLWERKQTYTLGKPPLMARYARHPALSGTAPISSFSPAWITCLEKVVTVLPSTDTGADAPQTENTAGVVKSNSGPEMVISNNSVPTGLPTMRFATVHFTTMIVSA